jgi:beta-glucanase (GH16 family)
MIAAMRSAGGMTRAAPAVAAALALLLAGCDARPASPSAQMLDLSGFTQTFEENFQTLDIAAHADARWTAHTPWNGDFGDAVFTDPGPDGPFSKTADGLRITATRGPDGRWRSGLICSIDKDGPGQKGFSQQYGYFEMRARLPTGMGVWPAFWLVGTDKTKTAAEIDVIEFYGGFPRYYHSVAHIWDHGKDTLSSDHITTVPEGSLSAGFNNYGVLIDPEVTTIYLNRRAVWSIPTPPEYRQPMYILANLALGGGWPIGELSSPQVMDIQYIRAFRLKGQDAPPKAVN